MDPEYFERNETLSETDINLELTNTPKESFNITPIRNQILSLNPVLQKSYTVYPSTPLKRQKKSLPLQTCNNRSMELTPNPNKMAATA